VSSKGQISDPFKCLSNVVACSPQTFFKKFAALAVNETKEHTYYNKWKKMHQRIGNQGSLNEEVIPYSSMYAMQQFLKNIPDYSLLHIANSNSIRLANYFNVAEHVEVYDNRGTHGIDGSMSAFIGQAQVSECLCFLVIGDLSFFYDMNALWNQYIGKNIRILVCNNSGGAIFHSYPNTKNVPTLDEHIAAAHQTSVKDWVMSRGFQYLTASDKEEFDKAMIKFISEDSKKPIILEAFTDMEGDAAAIQNILKPYATEDTSIRHKIGSMMPPEVKKTIKKIIK
jgi:2-succinyl-5-enolpyruvyl-6-hydroxy-3-cyclohexene-1-carboxylate synthase